RRPVVASACPRYGTRSVLATFAATCLALITIAGLGHAQEWTRFRGPNGSGQSEATTIPATWTVEDQLCKATLPGAGHSAPGIWGDKVFLTSADSQQGTRHVLCLSAVDGRTHWQRDYPSQAHKIHELNTLASSTPTVDDQRVYCAWSTPDEFTV